ncbi:class I SAM-dependent methyltransferase, partial [Candidatus Bathyarchaeota archaeon]|nr:class I SAM-dependent methyltransferase [Candidatus Bathyarchaeota archaeon]
KAQEQYIADIGKVFANIRNSLHDDGVVAIVVNDKNKLYRNLALRIGFVQEKSIKRHVNRRTGRRANDFYEEVLIWRKE